MNWQVLRLALIAAHNYKWVLIGIGIFVLLSLVGFLAQWKDFQRELRYINMEIQRNTGRERAHWEKKRRRLLLSLIPFVRY